MEGLSTGRTGVSIDGCSTGQGEEELPGFSRCSSISCCEKIMTMRTDKRKGRQAPVRFREPARKDFLAFYGGIAVGVIALGAFRAALDWSRGTFFVAVALFEILYLAVGLNWLLGRDQKRLSSNHGDEGS